MNDNVFGRFHCVYALLAKKGVCDTPGGMEYRRVRSEWIAAGMPRPISRFIRERANVGPGPEDDYLTDEQQAAIEAAIRLAEQTAAAEALLKRERRPSK